MQPSGCVSTVRFGCGQLPPVTSNLNFSPGQTSPNFVVARVGANGDVCPLTNTQTQLVADLVE